MEPTAILNFALWNNVPWKRNYQLTKDGSVVSLVGVDLHMQFRVAPGSDEVACDLSTKNGKLKIIDAVNGIWAFNVSIEDAFQVPAGNYFHDMLGIPAVGDPFPIMSGTVAVTQGITRSEPAWT